MSEIETPYYLTEHKAPKSRRFDWLASAAIIRKDTGEAVSHISARGPSKEVATKNVDTLLREALEQLREPVDWGRDPRIPGLIRAYLSAKEEVLSLSWRNKEDSESQQDWSAECHRKEHALEVPFKADFAERVAQLTEQQMIELVTLTPRELENPIDPWVLDEIEARFQLYRLISNPVPAVRSAYQSLRLQLQCEESANLPQESGKAG